MAGNKKARVFPEPVDEIPIMSRPARAIGHPCDWIGDAVYIYIYDDDDDDDDDDDGGGHYDGALNKTMLQ